MLVLCCRESGGTLLLVPAVEQTRIGRPYHLEALPEDALVEIHVFLPPPHNVSVHAAHGNIVRLIDAHHPVRVRGPVTIRANDGIPGGGSVLVPIDKVQVVHFEELGEEHALTPHGVASTPIKEVVLDLHVHVTHKRQLRVF